MKDNQYLISPRQVSPQSLRSCLLPAVLGPHPNPMSHRTAQPVTRSYLSVPRKSQFLAITPETIEQRFADSRDRLSSDELAMLRAALAEIPGHLRATILDTIVAAIIDSEAKQGQRADPASMVWLLSAIPPGFYHAMRDQPELALGLLRSSLHAQLSEDQLWANIQDTATSDWNLPEVAAIYDGAEAIHGFVASGGTFDEDLLHTGVSLAHHAAMATCHHVGAVAAFIKAGGRFHDECDNLGRTPTLALVLSARSADAIALFAGAGGRFTRFGCTARDRFGESALDAAPLRGDEFVDAVEALLAQADGAPCQH